MEGFSSEQVILHGDGGFFEGEEYILSSDVTYTVGRSSMCDISMKRTSRYANLEEEGLLLDDSFRFTSRKHFTIRVSDDSEYAETSTHLQVRVKGSIKVTLRCLSSNGMKVDGRSVTEMVIPELAKGVHIIEIGAGERFRLYLRRIP